MSSTPPPEDDIARIIPLGEPIEGGEILFEGTLHAAREYLAALSRGQREAVSIWTPGHIFSAAELAAEVPGHEHDPEA